MLGHGICFLVVEQDKSGMIFLTDTLLSIITGSDFQLGMILSPKGHDTISGVILGFHKMCMVLLEASG